MSHHVQVTSPFQQYMEVCSSIMRSSLLLLLSYRRYPALQGTTPASVMVLKCIGALLMSNMRRHVVSGTVQIEVARE